MREPYQRSHDNVGHVHWQVSVFHSLDHHGIYQQREHMAFGDPTDPWNVACSRYTLDTYVKPFASPGKHQYLSEYMDITGLLSSISFYVDKEKIQSKHSLYFE
jgi:hypothetical protein